MPGLEALPFGSEIAAAALAVLAGLLGLIARSITRSEKQTGPDLQTQLEQHDRHIAQLIQSLGDNITRMHREREQAEHAREVKTLEDEIDRLRRNARTPR